MYTVCASIHCIPVLYICCVYKYILLPSAPLGGSTPAPPPPSSSSSGSARGSFHPNLLSEIELDILQSRAGLIIRMIQLKIGQDLLLQVFNKLLTLASAAAQTAEWSLWQNLIISTGGVCVLSECVSQYTLFPTSHSSYMYM